MTGGNASNAFLRLRADSSRSLITFWIIFMYWQLLSSFIVDAQYL